MTPELLYFTDPYCIWCFGFAQSIEKVSNEYKGRFKTRVINGDMVPRDMMLRDFFGRFPDPVALHDRVTEAAGRAFGSDYMREIKGYRNSQRVLNSTTPSRAMAAFKALGVSDEVALASAMHTVYYIDGNDLQKMDSYKPIAAQFGIDFAGFVEKFNSLFVNQAVAEDYKFVQALGIQGYPAVVLKTADQRYVMVARGFMPYEQLKQTMDAVADAHLPKIAPAEGMVCSLETGTC